jgi:hypothetical protein
MTSQKSLALDPASWAAAGAVGKWVGEKIAGGIVGAAAGKLFGEVMNAIGLGGPDLVGKLDKISDQLVQVQQSLDRLTAMTAEILKQLAELRDFMEETLKLQTLDQAMGRINTTYGKPSRQALLQDVPETVDLRMLVEKMPHFGGVTDQQLRDASKKFATWVKDVPDCIATIHRVLTQSAYGQTSLVEHWVNGLVKQVKANKIGREAAYLVLEGYFLQAVSTQLKGVSVHCVALGAADHGKAFIQEYLEDHFAEMMADETAAFLKAVEFLMFSTLAPTMPAGLQNPNGERDFPQHVDEILLRADLISAALNLVGHKPEKPSPSIQAAIQGIYGRSLVRPADLTNGVPPTITLPKYPSASGTDVRPTPLPCLDFKAENDRAVLKDVSSTTATVARYFWKFPDQLPEVGVPIDYRRRGGVTPARYPVFGPDQPPVLAASLLDVSRLYCGIGEWLPRSYKYFKFPGQYPYIGFDGEENREFGGHPISSVRGSCFEAFFTAFHTYQAEVGQHTLVSHHLFKYSGAPAKVRLTAQVVSKIHRDPRLTSAQWWEVYHRLKLKNLTKGWEREFYNSVEAYGSERPISINGVARADSALYAPYDARREGTFPIDFELEAADYELLFDAEAAFHHDSNGYHGWHKTSMMFVLSGLWLERVF